MFHVAGTYRATDTVAQDRANRAQSLASQASGEIKDLQRQVERLSLLNQALWELIREKLQLTDADLERMAQDVDLRDGVADGRITARAVRCPTCTRVNNTRHKKCIYCATEFASMLFE